MIPGNLMLQAKHFDGPETSPYESVYEPFVILYCDAQIIFSTIECFLTNWRLWIPSNILVAYTGFINLRSIVAKHSIVYFVVCFYPWQR